MASPGRDSAGILSCGDTAHNHLLRINPLSPAPVASDCLNSGYQPKGKLLVESPMERMMRRANAPTPLSCLALGGEKA